MKNTTPPPRIPSVWAFIVCLPAVGVLLAIMIMRSLAPLDWAGIPVLLFYCLCVAGYGYRNLRRIRQTGGSLRWYEEPSMRSGCVFGVFFLLIWLERLFIRR